ncbi:MAG TPA: hypothetical protein PLL71_08210, partial [Agriterribacter sp.]|nr:hypothetical protein [Agriterribacter sp.]
LLQLSSNQQSFLLLNGSACSSYKQMYCVLLIVVCLHFNRIAGNIESIRKAHFMEAGYWITGETFFACLPGRQATLRSSALHGGALLVKSIFLKFTMQLHKFTCRIKT